MEEIMKIRKEMKENKDKNMVIRYEQEEEEERWRSRKS